MSNLILNKRGAIYHLNMKPSELGTTVILVEKRMQLHMIYKNFDTIIKRRRNREYSWVTGRLNFNKITVISTGIGTKNIDLVLSQLEAVANIDFRTGKHRKKHKILNIIELGIGGTIQDFIPVD